MKTTSKYNFKKLMSKSSALLALILLMPLSSLALEGTQTGSVSGSSSTFCTNFAAESARISARMTEQSTKLASAWSQQDSNVSSKTESNVQKVAEARAKSDSTRATNFTTLESKATNSAQKQAVQIYEAAVKSAVSTRRSSYDAAKSSFRSAVQTAVAARHTSVNAQLSTFNAAVNNAISTASASCKASPTNSSMIHDTFKASLKSAKTAFENGRSSDATVGSAVKQLAITRNNAFKVADSAFQAAMSAAKDALKVAFTKAV